MKTDLSKEASNNLEEYLKTKDRSKLDDFLEILRNNHISAITVNNIDENDIGFLYEKVDDNNSLIEYIVKNNIDITLALKKIIRKHGDLLKICIDYGYMSIFDFSSKEDYEVKINNVTVLEYLFMEKKVNINHIRYLRTPEVLELCKKYNRFDLLPHLYNELFYLDLDEKDKVIDYLFKNNLITPELINSRCTNPLIIDYCIKYNRNDLLEFLNETVLLCKNKDNITFLETAIDNNLKITATFNSMKSIKIIIDKGRFDLLKKTDPHTVIKKYDSNEYIYDLLLEHNIDYDFEKMFTDLYFFPSDESELKRLIETLYKHNKIDCLKNIDKKYYTLEVNGKYLLDILIEHKFIPTFKYITDEKIVKILIKHGLFDVFKNPYNVSNDIYMCMFDENNTILDVLLQKGIDPLRTIGKIEIAKIYVKYGLYSALSKCSSEVLMEKLDNGRTVLEEMYENGGNLNRYKKDPNREIAKTILKYKKYQDLLCLDIDTLFSLADLNDMYIDILLKEHKKDENIYIVYDSHWLDFEQKTKLYKKYAEYDLTMYLSRLKKEDLLEEQDGKRFIDVLIENTTQEELDKIINSKIREDFEIAMILKLHGFNQSEIRLDSITKDFVKEYYKEFYKDYDDVELDSESEGLINQYRNLMNDGTSDMELVETVIRSYKHLIKINSKYKEELKYLIMLKIKSNQEQKTYSVKHTDDGAYYSPVSNSIFLDSILVDTLNHEMGHSLYHNMSEFPFDEEMLEEMLSKMRTSSDFLLKVKKYSEEYQKIKSEVEKYVDEHFMSEYDKSITEEQIKLIEEFLSASKEKNKKHYLEKGYSEDVLDVILDRTFTVEEYIEQDRRVKRRELIDAVLRTQYSAFTSIGDYFDGIYEGRFRDNLLRDKDGKVIEHAYGHGVNYYSDRIEFVFDEMIANYSEIVKSRNPEEGLRLLREYIGDELVDYIVSFYDNNILNSNKLKEQESAMSL